MEKFLETGVEKSRKMGERNFDFVFHFFFGGYRRKEKELKRNGHRTAPVKLAVILCLFFFFGSYSRKEKEPKRNGRSKGRTYFEAVK